MRPLAAAVAVLGFNCFKNSKTSSLSASEANARPSGSEELRMRRKGLPGACCCSAEWIEAVVGR